MKTRRYRLMVLVALALGLVALGAHPGAAHT